MKKTDITKNRKNVRDKLKSGKYVDALTDDELRVIIADVADDAALRGLKGIPRGVLAMLSRRAFVDSPQG